MGKISATASLVLAASMGWGPWLAPAFADAEPAADARVQTASYDTAVQALVEKLGQLGDKAARTTEPEKIAFYNIQQASVIGEIVAHTSAQEQATWLKQMIDCLHVAALNSPANDRAAYRWLVRLEERLNQTSPGSALAAYATYREIQSDYIAKLNAPDANANQIQQQWLEKLMTFVQTYPSAEDTASALLELGTVSEFLGKDVEAMNWYQQLVENFAGNPLAAKGTGYLRRLQLEGHVLGLALPLLYTENDNIDDPFDIEELRGKVVVVYFWTSSSPQCTHDFEELKKVRDHYASRGLELLCVNLDKTKQEARAFLGRSPAAGVHVFQHGGLEGRASVRCGIMSVPSIILVGRDGKVIRRSAEIGSLDDELNKIMTGPRP